MAKQTKPLTQAQFKEQMIEMTGMTKKEVNRFFECQADLVAQQLSKKNIGSATIPDLGVKVQLKVKPATKAREGRNPATGESMMIPAKPKRTVIKASIMKKLKDRVFGV